MSAVQDQYKYVCQAQKGQAQKRLTGVYSFDEYFKTRFEKESFYFDFEWKWNKKTLIFCGKACFYTLTEARSSTNQHSA